MAAKRNPVDAYVGSRLRLRRTLVGLSQEKLGAAVDLTFQQIQKYEKGANRVSASRIYQFARLLDVKPAYFFEGIEEHLGSAAPGMAAGLAEEPEPFEGPDESELLYTREAIELMRAFARIEDQSVRRRLFELVRSVAEGLDELPGK